MIQTEQVVVIDLGMCVCVRQQLMRKEAVERRRVVWEGMERGMGMEKAMTISKKKQFKKKMVKSYRHTNS